MKKQTHPNLLKQKLTFKLVSQACILYKCRGDRAFATTAPRLWNDLPMFIRMASSVAIFKSKLKTYLFDKAFYPG